MSNAWNPVRPLIVKAVAVPAPPARQAATVEDQ
jgi:hypothetical protein